MTQGNESSGHLKNTVRAQRMFKENEVKISKKNAKWQKITFRGLILVPKVAFWGYWGLVCIEKWSYNFDSGTRSAISGTPKIAETTPFSHFGGTRNGTLVARIKIVRPLSNTN